MKIENSMSKKEYFTLKTDDDVDLDPYQYLEEKTYDKIIYFPTLYLKKKDRVNVWKIQVEGNKYKSFSGIDGDGYKLKMYEGYGQQKNIGKKNEKSEECHALTEAYSRWFKKRDREGYDTSVKDIKDMYPIKS